jgi:gluconate 2-dehydrogenase gamma chain
MCGRSERRLSRFAQNRISLSAKPTIAPRPTADTNTGARRREVIMANDIIARRKFLLGAGVAGTAVAAGLAQPAPVEAQTPTAPAAAKSAGEPQGLLTLNAAEAAFLAAAADTLIPADELSPSGSDCGLVTFCDRQLASDWGGGARMYRSGPFRKGKPEHGYQLPLTPREFFAAGIAATNAWTRKAHGKDFDGLSPADRAAALKELESGKAQLVDFNGRQFFGALYNLVMEGFFADPIYGGNKDKISWRMIGYPGLPALYANLIEDYRDKRYRVEPRSIADFS